MRLFFLINILFLLSCAGPVNRKVASSLNIIEINPNELTSLTKKQLVLLNERYDLSPFLYTTKIQIQSRVIPHSHPILTLNTRNAHFPDKILSTFLHEEFHWWAEAQKTNIKKAIIELKVIYPQLPNIGGARNDDSTYLHLIVCFLELKATSKYLGEEKAKEIISSFAQKDNIYPWVYKQVLENFGELEKIIVRNELIPPGL